MAAEQLIHGLTVAEYEEFRFLSESMRFPLPGDFEFERYWELVKKLKVRE